MNASKSRSLSGTLSGTLTAAVLTAIALTACGPDSDPAPKGDSGTSVREIRLTDGTRCAVMDKRGSGGAAIDCDWKRP